MKRKKKKESKKKDSFYLLPNFLFLSHFISSVFLPHKKPFLLLKNCGAGVSGNV